MSSNTIAILQASGLRSSFGFFCFLFQKNVLCLSKPDKSFNQPLFMSNRRKFLQQGSMATAALLFMSRGKSFAGSSFFFGSDENSLVILHSHLPAGETGFTFGEHSAYTKNIIASEKRKYNNLLLVDDKMAEERFTVIQKGNIRTGIINASYGSGMDPAEINELARSLKENKQCQLVICLSELGFENKNRMDDRSFAASSEHIDIIIGNTCTPGHLPSVVLNKNKQEVLINHCAHDAVAVGRIELRFDRQGNKNAMAWSNMLYRNNSGHSKNFSLS